MDGEPDSAYAAEQRRSTAIYMVLQAAGGTCEIAELLTRAKLIEAFLKGETKETTSA